MRVGGFLHASVRAPAGRLARTYSTSSSARAASVKLDMISGTYWLRPEERGTFLEQRREMRAGKVPGEQVVCSLVPAATLATFRTPSVVDNFVAQAEGERFLGEFRVEGAACIAE